ncbi:DMT family transporter [Bacillus marinisedimentorum]|uniref:DMT family transporter n=1 Tax=Bacillus marinisedimentorum TaxID=1821260 RepID=UPI00087284B3|nr:DMT family transporter [Bacillus marinisedimentorum]
MNAEKFFTNRYGVVAAAVAATFLWGSAFPFIKLSYSALDIHSEETAEQILFAGYRFFIASLMILVFFRLLKRDMKIKQGTVVPLIKLGALQTFFQYILFYIGLSYSTGIQGSIIAGSTSFFQILFAHFLYKDDALSIRKGIGLIIGFTGVILVNLTKGSLELKFGIGELFLMGAMMISAFGNIYARDLSRHMPVPYLTAYQMLFGSIALLAASITSAGVFPFDFNVKSGMILIYLAFLSAAGFVIWNNVMKFNKVGKVSMYLFLVPVFGVFLSALLLGEALHAFVLLGLVLVALGIVIVNRQPSV